MTNVFLPVFPRASTFAMRIYGARLSFSSEGFCVYRAVAANIPPARFRSLPLRTFSPIMIDPRVYLALDACDDRSGIPSEGARNATPFGQNRSLTLSISRSLGVVPFGDNPVSSFRGGLTSRPLRVVFRLPPSTRSFFFFPPAYRCRSFVGRFVPLRRRRRSRVVIIRPTFTIGESASRTS